MAIEGYVLMRVVGWVLIFSWFVFEFIETEEGWVLPQKLEIEVRDLLGAVGTFLVLFGYVMLNL